MRVSTDAFFCRSGRASCRKRETTVVSGRRLHDVAGAYYPLQNHQQYLPNCLDGLKRPAMATRIPAAAIGLLLAMSFHPEAWPINPGRPKIRPWSTFGNILRKPITAGMCKRRQHCGALKSCLPDGPLSAATGNA